MIYFCGKISVLITLYWLVVIEIIFQEAIYYYLCFHSFMTFLPFYFWLIFRLTLHLYMFITVFVSSY